MRYCPGTKWAAEIGVPKIELAKDFNIQLLRKRKTFIKFY